MHETLDVALARRACLRKLAVSYLNAGGQVENRVHAADSPLDSAGPPRVALGGVYAERNSPVRCAIVG